MISLVTSGVALALTSTNQTSGTGQTSISVIQLQKNTLVVGSEQDYPPFATGMTDATADGFTVELWKAVAAEAGLNYTLRVRPFRQILQEFKDGEIDVLINLAESTERHQFADFTVAHVIVNGAIFVRKGEESLIQSEDDLADKSIIVLNADLAHDYAVSKGWEKQLVLVDTSAEGLRLLSSGKHDALLLSKLAGMQMLQDLGLTNIKALKIKPGFSQKFAFAVSEGQSDLLSKINEGLALTKSNGIYDALYEKWLGVYEDKDVSLDDLLVYIIPIAAIFLSIAGYAFYRRQVEVNAAENKYRDLYDYAPDMFMSVEAKNATIINCNQTLLSATGYAREDIIGHSVFELYHPDCAEFAWQVFQQFIASKELQGVVLQLRCKDGSKIDVSLNATAVCDAHGAILHSRSTLRDITERNQMEEMLRKLSIAVEQSPASVVITGLDACIQYVNPHFTEVTGYTSAEVMGKNPRIFQSGLTTHEQYLALWDTLANGESWHGELINQRKNGELYWEESYVTPVKNPAGTITHYVAVKTDITERKQAEIKLRESERKLSEILESVDAYIYLKDTQGRYLFANRPVRELFGASIEEIVGYSDEHFFSAETAAKLRITDLQVLMGGETVRAEETNHSLKDESTSTYLSVKLPLRNEADEVYALCGISTNITERKQAEETIVSSRNLLLTIIDNSPMRVFWKDLNLCYLGCNTAFAKDAGMSHPKEIIGKDDFQMRWSAQAELYHIDDRAVMESGIARLSYDEPQTTPDGKIIWRRTSKVPLRNNDDEVFGILGIYEDVTERKRVEDKLQLAANVFSYACEGIMITDPKGIIIDVNDTFTRITGYERHDVIGKKPNLLSSGRQSKAFYAAMWADMLNKDRWVGEIWNQRKSGEFYAIMQTVSAVRDEQGSIKQFLALFSDITEHKTYEQQLEHIAHYDPLTNLPNRVLLADRLRHAMTQAQRRGQRVALAFLDLDGFKAINDSHGHDAGDQLLITIATRMRQALRESDTLARLGGDEFVAVLVDLDDLEAGVPMLARLLAAAAQPVQFGAFSLQVSASLGVSFYPQADDVDADQLLRQADQSMYQAKLAGKNRYHIFDAEQDSSIRGFHESLDRIRRALIEREFVLFYQPKVNMRTGEVIGAEALIRWQHPDKGLLPPALFLPMIEDHPLAVDIGEWVIDTALSQIELWQAAGLDLPVSVNIGARQLQQTDFASRLQALLAAHPSVSPGRLEMELLETSALKDLAHVSQVLHACREMGVKFALDDFGTGYSSLTYLKRLPVTTLKIDQSFVRDMLEDPEDLAIIEGVVGLATAFHRQVVAEGVETVEHGALLLQFGCELAQGYGIARPMRASDMCAWAATWQPDAVWANLAPVKREDLPLLFANVEYLAWIRHFEAFLKGASKVPPPQDRYQCRFSTWMDTDGPARYAALPAFQIVELLDREAHQLADELMGLQTLGNNVEALARLPELYEIKARLLEQLRGLLQVIH